MQAHFDPCAEALLSGRRGIGWRALGAGPAVEQRRPNAQLRCDHLARHNSSACSLYSTVYLAGLRAGFDNCVFMWTLSGFDPKPTVRQIRATPD